MQDDTEAHGLDDHGVDDLFAVASGRLLAAGVERDARLRALRLLSALLDSAGVSGRVLLPLPDVARLAGLPLDEAEAACHALVDVEVVDEIKGVLHLAPEAVVEDRSGSSLFLADLAAVLERNEAAPAAPIPRARRRSAGRQLTRHLAELGAAAAVAVAVGAVVASSSDPPSPGGGEGDRVAAPAPTTTVVAEAPGATFAVACPTGAPVLEVATATPSLEGGPSVPASPEDGWFVLVSGTLANPGAAPVSVRGIEVEVDVAGRHLSAPGPAAAVEVAAGAAVPWTIEVAAGTLPPTLGASSASYREWSWADPALASCPTSV